MSKMACFNSPPFCLEHLAQGSPWDLPRHTHGAPRPPRARPGLPKTLPRHSNIDQKFVQEAAKKRLDGVLGASGRLPVPRSAQELPRIPRDFEFKGFWWDFLSIWIDFCSLFFAAETRTHKKAHKPPQSKGSAAVAVASKLHEKPIENNNNYLLRAIPNQESLCT